MNIEILNTRDPQWRQSYDGLDETHKDIFYHPGFAAVCQESIDSRHQVRCAMVHNDKGILLYPFVQRQLAAGSLYDITGLYGRGGVATNIQQKSLLEEFHLEFAAWCKDHHIVCGFDRFHPVTKNHLAASTGTKIFETGQFVVLELTDPIEEIERHFEHEHRKSIKKAERAEVEIFYEQNLAHLDEFLSIYHSTLDRREAESFYYFPKNFYQGLLENIPGRFAFFYARYEGHLISCELVLFEGAYGHSYLGGTLFDYRHVCPNVLLKRDIIRYLKAQHCRYFLLGGGNRPNDGIFRYKLGFSPKGERPSYIGGTIYDPQAYENLGEVMAAKGCAINKNRFQFYDPFLVEVG